MKLELLAASASFGAASVFWLCTAYAISADSFGLLMQWYAAVVLLVSFFSMRTYDLLFYLKSRTGSNGRNAFCRALKVECAAYAASSLLVSALCLISPALGGNFSPMAAIAMGMLSSTAVLLGASQALLRTVKRERDLAFSDAVALLAFVAAAAGVLWLRPDSATLLLWALAAFAVKPLVQLAFALVRLRNLDQEPVPAEQVAIGGYVFSGQLTNVLKNNFVALETLLLAQVAPTQAVALLRLSRSFVNFTTVLLNQAYQRAFLQFSQRPENEHPGLMRRMNWLSLKLFALAIPVVILAAFAFQYLKSDSAYQDLLLVVGLTLLAAVPVALQQSHMAYRLLKGQFRRVNVANVAGMSLIALVTLATPWVNDVYSFLILCLIAATVRWLMMRAAPPAR